jgi:hypothetical protein
MASCPKKARLAVLVALCVIIAGVLAPSALADARHLHVFIDGSGGEDRNAWSDPYYTSYSGSQWLQRTGAWHIDGTRANNEVWLQCYSNGVLKKNQHWGSVEGGTANANDFANFTTLKGETRWYLQFKADLNNEPDLTGHDWSNYF